MTTPAFPLERTDRRKNWLHLAVRLATPLVILGLLWNLADGPGALALLGDMDWTYVILAFVAVNLQTLLSAWRWHGVAGRLGLAIPPKQAVAEYYLSQVVNQSLPGGVLGDAARAVRMRHSAGLGIAARAVIIERMAGQVAMFTLLAFGLGWAMIAPGGIETVINPLYVLVTLVACAVVALGAWIVLRAKRALWPRNFWQAVHKSLISDGAWVEQALLGAAITALNLTSFALCALATGTTPGTEAVLVLIPLILCAMLVPTTIAGWGFREGAAAALFPLAGASAASGFAASLLFGLVILAASLPGLLVLIPNRQRHSPHR